MEKLTLKKTPNKLLPLHPASPRPLFAPGGALSPMNEPRPRTSSLQRVNDCETTDRVVNTLPPELRLKKEFVIKSAKPLRTPEKRRTTPSKRSLQTLFKKVDEEEEKDFLDLIQHLNN